MGRRVGLRSLLVRGLQRPINRVLTGPWRSLGRALIGARLVALLVPLKDQKWNVVMAIDNKQIARRMFEELWNQGKEGLIDQLVDRNYEGHEPLVGRVDLEGYRASFKNYRAAFPDLKFVINAMYSEGNFVTTRWTASGTHKGPLMGMEPTGKSAVVEGLSLGEFRDGRLVVGYTSWDTLSFMRQLEGGAQSASAPAKQPSPREEARH